MILSHYFCETCCIEVLWSTAMGPIFVTQWKGFFNNSDDLKSALLEIVAQDHHESVKDWNRQVWVF